MTSRPPIPSFITSDRLTAGTAHSSVRHGFFSRHGGVAEGLYASLNVGPGSDDLPAHVRENRTRCAAAFGAAGDQLLTVYQVHSPRVVVVDKPFGDDRPRADAMVTTQKGLILGVLAADCMPYLFADPMAGVIGAAHAGWRGALAGVLEATVTAMIGLGARPDHIIAAVGPCMRQPNFEVGLDLLATFTEKYPEADRFFTPGASHEKRQLDLVSFGLWRLAGAGVTQVDDIDICTLGAPNDYFSYRANRRAGAADYGRNLSAIVQ